MQALRRVYFAGLLLSAVARYTWSSLTAGGSVRSQNNAW